MFNRISHGACLNNFDQAKDLILVAFDFDDTLYPEFTGGTMKFLPEIDSKDAYSLNKVIPYFSDIPTKLLSRYHTEQQNVQLGFHSRGANWARIFCVARNMLKPYPFFLEAYGTYSVLNKTLRELINNTPDLVEKHILGEAIHPLLSTELKNHKDLLHWINQYRVKRKLEDSESKVQPYNVPFNMNTETSQSIGSLVEYSDQEALQKLSFYDQQGKNIHLYHMLMNFYLKNKKGPRYLVVVDDEPGNLDTNVLKKLVEVMQQLNINETYPFKNLEIITYQAQKNRLMASQTGGHGKLYASWNLDELVDCIDAARTNQLEAFMNEKRVKLPSYAIQPKQVVANEDFDDDAIVSVAKFIEKEAIDKAIQERYAVKKRIVAETVEQLLKLNSLPLIWIGTEGEHYFLTSKNQENPFLPLTEQTQKIAELRRAQVVSVDPIYLINEDNCCIKAYSLPDGKYYVQIVSAMNGDENPVPLKEQQTSLDELKKLHIIGTRDYDMLYSVQESPAATHSSNNVTVTVPVINKQYAALQTLLLDQDTKDLISALYPALFDASYALRPFNEVNNTGPFELFCLEFAFNMTQFDHQLGLAQAYWNGLDSTAKRTLCESNARLYAQEPLSDEALLALSNVMANTVSSAPMTTRTSSATILHSLDGETKQPSATSDRSITIETAKRIYQEYRSEFQDIFPLLNNDSSEDTFFEMHELLSACRDQFLEKHSKSSVAVETQLPNRVYEIDESWETIEQTETDSRKLTH